MKLRVTPKDESDPSPDLILRPPSPLERGKRFVSIPLRRGEGGGHAPPGEGSLFGAGPRYTLCKSKSEAQRQIKAGAVSLAAGDLDNPIWVKVTDPAAEFDPSTYTRTKNYLDMVFKVGRKQNPVIRFKFPPK